MQFTVPVCEEFVQKLRAGIHIDYTTRPQVCLSSDNPEFHRVLRHFGSHFGIEAVSKYFI